MTAVTLHLEDKIFSHLKQSAERGGYSIDGYILHVLSMNYKDLDENRKQSNVDAFLGSMQFRGVNMPLEENGKGSLAPDEFVRNIL